MIKQVICFASGLCFHCDFFSPEILGYNFFFFFLSLQAGWTPLHIAASAGRDEIVKALLDKGAHVNAVNQNGCTPLHYAASKNKQEIAIMLLENGADPDATDHFESTPLHRAANTFIYSQDTLN
uniref:Proteasome 26S subunit, non-ATPase 10 n=1 Tax=Anas platyrhynchos platyrhynchos TaxID=8840 RepID=A0A493U247_ANAPP